MDGGVRRGFCFPQKGKLRFCGKGEGCRISHIKKKEEEDLFIACPPSPYLLTVTPEEDSSLLMSHEDLYMASGSPKKTPTS